jgi:hypothetical protein
MSAVRPSSRRRGELPRPYGQLARRGGWSSPLSSGAPWNRSLTGRRVRPEAPGRSRTTPARTTTPMAREVPRVWAAPPPQAGARPHGSPVGSCRGSPLAGVSAPVTPVQGCCAHQSCAECATVSIPPKAMAATSRPSRMAWGCLAVVAAWDLTWPRYAAASPKVPLRRRRFRPAGLPASWRPVARQSPAWIARVARPGTPRLAPVAAVGAVGARRPAGR